MFRTWSETDLPLGMSLWSDPGVMAHMGGPMTAAGVRARLALEISRQQTRGVQYWPMFLRGPEGCEPGEFAGCAGLRPWHDEPQVFELGVHVARRFWSQRLGEEAARTVVLYAFKELGVKALTAGHGPGHANSQAMLQRVGFRYTHEEPWGTQGVLHPFYRLERAEYEATKPSLARTLPGCHAQSMKLRTLLCALGCWLVCSVAGSAQQEKGNWRAASTTAKGITGDIALAEYKVYINFAAFTIAQIRALKPEEASAAFVSSVPGGNGNLYRLSIPASKQFLHHNTLCGSEDTQWMATYAAGKSLQVTFFSGESMPMFTEDALKESPSLCGTFLYVR